MSQEIATTTDTWINVVGPVAKLADHISRSPFVPRAMQGKPEHVAAAILLGREMGLGPMASLRGIDVIEGKPALTAQMLAARIYAAGHRVEWLTATDKTCTVRITRGDGLSSAEVTWTMADATRAGLAGKTNWKKYPRAMLRARALTEAAAMACPDVALGLEAPDTTPDTPAPAHAGTTVQVHLPDVTDVTEVTDAPPREAEVEPVAEVVVVDPEPEPDDGPEMHTPGQMRKLRAMLNDVPGGPDEHRELIRELVELPDLTSARDLTKEQMHQAIDRLDQLLHGTVVDAEVIEG